MKFYPLESFRRKISSLYIWFLTIQSVYVGRLYCSIMIRNIKPFMTYYHPQTKSVKVMFLHVSVHRGGGGVPGQVPPWTRYIPWAGTPPRPGTTPWVGTTPRPGKPPSLDQVHPPGLDTPLQTRYIPPEQCMLGDTGNKRAVYILLECILVLNSFHTYPNFLLYMRRLKCHEISVKKGRSIQFFQLLKLNRFSCWTNTYTVKEIQFILRGNGLS